MLDRTGLLYVLVVAVGWSGAACSGSTKGARTTQTPLDPSDLYPFKAENAWSYDVDIGEPTTTLAVTRVDSFDGRDAEVRTGDTLIRYRVLPEGIFIPEEQAWLIKAPVQEGNTWRSRGGRTAEIVSVNQSAQTPAGSFESCVEVVETGGELGLRVRTIYCPRIGPVSVTSTLRPETSGREVSVVARLRGYDAK